MDDQERFHILKALDELLSEKGIAPSGKDLLKFYAATTKSTIAIDEKAWLQKVASLQNEGDIEAKPLIDHQGIADLEAINLSSQGIQFLKMKNHNNQSPKNWFLAVLKWMFPSGLALIVFVWGIWVYFHPTSNISKQDEFIRQQKTACGLYGQFLSVKFRLDKKEKKINVERLKDYIRSGEYLSSDAHVQIENLLTSLNNGNFQAAKDQINDLISKMENNYGCKKSNSQLGVNGKIPAASADVTAVFQKN